MAHLAGNSAAVSALFRKQLRQAKIAEREALATADQQRAAAAIEARLWEILSPREPGVVGFCWPLRGEIDCRPLVGRLLAAGWQACQPVVLQAAAPMVFRAWIPGAAMTHDRHGIPIPAGTQTARPDVLLLPLVAFDDQGYRLGYGGGYFDRTLAALAPRPLAIGVGYERARVESVRPEGHDIRLDMIITEAGTRRFPAGG